MQEIFGQRAKDNFDRTEAVQTFVTIFLAGMKLPEEAIVNMKSESQ
jgi:hypothetical protein